MLFTVTNVVTFSLTGISRSLNLPELNLYSEWNLNSVSKILKINTLFMIENTAALIDFRAHFLFSWPTNQIVTFHNRPIKKQEQPSNQTSAVQNSYLFLQTQAMQLKIRHNCHIFMHKVWLGVTVSKVLKRSWLIDSMSWLANTCIGNKIG